jgi:hypothetical protein
VRRGGRQQQRAGGAAGAAREQRPPTEAGGRGGGAKKAFEIPIRAKALGPQRATVQQVAAIPLPGGPLGWRGIAETASTYPVSRITLLPSTVAAPQVIPKGPDSGIVRTTSDYRLVRIFQDFARFPVIEYRQQGGEQIVRYFDLRFTGYGRDKSWLDLEVRLDIAGQVQMIEFLNRVFPPHHPDF